MFIKGKYVKTRFKNRGSPSYFLSSGGQKIKNITKIEQKRWFLCTFLVSFYMAFLAQKLIYTINIWLNFVFGSFFKQDHLLSLFISGVMRKDDLNVHVFQYKNWCSPKYDRWFIFLTLTVRGPFHRKDFTWKKYGVMGLISEKTCFVHRT